MVEEGGGCGGGREVVVEGCGGGKAWVEVRGRVRLVGCGADERERCGSDGVDEWSAGYFMFMM